MKNKVLFAVLALTSIVLTPIAVNASFYEPEVNFHGVKANLSMIVLLQENLNTTVLNLINSTT